jgi:RimJ/RimL family protein N-acetyltransferase
VSEANQKAEILVGKDGLLGPWICERTGGKWFDGLGTTIGLQRAGEIVAGVLYDEWNGASIRMHVASDGSRRWLNREFLRFAFWYPFEQLKVNRVHGVVAESNDAARKFDEHLGFVLEHRAPDAHPDGALLFYRMYRHECRWIEPLRKAA